jgi:hypothetical protein
MLVYSQNHAKHRNPFCGQNVEFFMSNLLLHNISPGLSKAYYLSFYLSCNSFRDGTCVKRKYAAYYGVAVLDETCLRSYKGNILYNLTITRGICST